MIETSILGWRVRIFSDYPKLLWPAKDHPQFVILDAYVGWGPEGTYYAAALFGVHVIVGP